MAILKTISLQNGLICENAYIKIVGIIGDKEQCTMNVGVFKDKTYAEEMNAIQIKPIDFTPDVTDTSPNFIKQGYLHLKSLSEYADAVDC